MKKQMLFSHPTGNANVRAALVGLLEVGLLGEFHTSIAAYPNNIWNRLGKSNWGRELMRRTFDDRLQNITVQYPFRELVRMLASRLKWDRLSRHETGPFCVDAIYRAQDRSVARRLRHNPKRFSAVYAYEDGALEAFSAAKELNLGRIYDLPIAYWKTVRQLLEEEASRRPDWKITLGGGVNDSAAKLDRKVQELELAEIVICPSKFVADSIPENLRGTKKIVMAPFGSPASGASGERTKLPAGKKLRVMFAGSMSQRKGLADLFEAMQQLNRSEFELVVMGNPQAPMEFYRKYFSGFIHESSRPHADVLKLMRTCDVFCLPSIAEGRALVIQEAMSQGLPVIITQNTGGEDLIDEGKTGFLVPIRRADLIASRLTWYAENRSALPEMSRAAQVKAGELTWSKYGQTIARAILESDHFCA